MEQEIDELESKIRNYIEEPEDNPIVFLAAIRKKIYISLAKEVIEPMPNLTISKNKESTRKIPSAIKYVAEFVGFCKVNTADKMIVQQIHLSCNILLANFDEIDDHYLDKSDYIRP